MYTILESSTDVRATSTVPERPPQVELEQDVLWIAHIEREPHYRGYVVFEEMIGPDGDGNDQFLPNRTREANLRPAYCMCTDTYV